VDHISRGRKRGVRIILASQRLAKVHKDATSECDLTIFGRMRNAADRKRACDELGEKPAEYQHTFLKLAPGSFLASGTAISAARPKLVHVRAPRTAPPTKQERASPPAPSDAVQRLLDELRAPRPAGPTPAPPREDDADEDEEEDEDADTMSTKSKPRGADDREAAVLAAIREHPEGITGQKLGRLLAPDSVEGIGEALVKRGLVTTRDHRYYPTDAQPSRASAPVDVGYVGRITDRDERAAELRAALEDYQIARATADDAWHRYCSLARANLKEACTSE
jgi:hypothetical protein